MKRYKKGVPDWGTPYKNVIICSIVEVHIRRKTVTGYSCNHVTAKNGKMSIELNNKLINNNLMIYLDIIAGLKVTWLQL